MEGLLPQSQLAEAHLEAQARLRDTTARICVAAWNALPDHGDSSVPLFVDTVVPVVEAGQRRSVQLVDAYFALEMERAAYGTDPREAIGAHARQGTDPGEVYRRPFVTLWSALKDRFPWEEANVQAINRLDRAVKTDVLLAMTRAGAAISDADPDIKSLVRVLRGTCSKCAEAVQSATPAGGLQPIHPGCQCAFMPSTQAPKDLPKTAGIAMARQEGLTWAQVAERFGLPSRRQINRMRQKLLDEGYDARGRKVITGDSIKAKPKTIDEVRAKRAKSETPESEKVGTEQYLENPSPAVRVDGLDKEHPELWDAKDIDFGTRAALNEYYKLSPEIRGALDEWSIAKGRAQVRIGKRITDMDPSQTGKQPRGWPKGSTWYDVGGMYSSLDDIAYAATEGASGSVNTLAHEVGHMMGKWRWFESGGDDWQLAASRWHRELYDKFVPYIKQDGPGSTAGTDEMIAETTAEYFTWSTAKFVGRYGKEYRSFLEKLHEDYARRTPS